MPVPNIQKSESIVENVPDKKVTEVTKPIDLLEDVGEAPIILDSIESQLETEEEFERCISTEPEIETVDIVIEPAKPKVQFYIADEILVLSPEKKKPVQTPLILKTLSELSPSKCLSLDTGFWPDKHPYHEAERYLFENLANYTREKPSDDANRDFDDRDFDGDRDGGLNDRGGNGGPLNPYFMGGPHTERLIADLPGGIGSWSDYSTYLSSENEQRTDQGTIETPISALTLPSDEPPSQESPIHLQDNRFESKREESPSEPLPLRPSVAEESKLQPRTVESGSSEQISNSDHEVASSIDRPSGRSPLESSPSLCEQSDSVSSAPLDSSSTPSVPSHHPVPKEHLGREGGSMQQWTPNLVTEREAGVAEDEAEKRIRGIKVRSRHNHRSIVARSSSNELAGQLCSADLRVCVPTRSPLRACTCVRVRACAILAYSVFCVLCFLVPSFSIDFLFSSFCLIADHFSSLLSAPVLRAYVFFYSPMTLCALTPLLIATASVRPTGCVSLSLLLSRIDRFALHPA